LASTATANGAIPAATASLEGHTSTQSTMAMHCLGPRTRASIARIPAAICGARITTVREITPSAADGLEVLDAHPSNQRRMCLNAGVAIGLEPVDLPEVRAAADDEVGAAVDEDCHGVPVWEMNDAGGRGDVWNERGPTAFYDRGQQGGCGC
jgi:hypothetical protein